MWWCFQIKNCIVDFFFLLFILVKMFFVEQDELRAAHVYDARHMRLASHSLITYMLYSYNMRTCLHLLYGDLHPPTHPPFDTSHVRHCTGTKFTRTYIRRVRLSLPKRACIRIQRQYVWRRPARSSDATTSPIRFDNRRQRDRSKHVCPP